jgi:hypothetical protein
MFALAMENKSVSSLDICRVRCISGNQELALQESVESNGAKHQVGPGQLVHLVFTIPRGELAEGDLGMERSREMMMLRASREASAPEEKPGRHKKEIIEDLVDLVVEWSSGSGRGEVYSLRVPYESPPSTASPCPLALHLLAAESAVFKPDLVVPVTLCMRNLSSRSNVSFYFEVQATQDVIWLGCEKSEVIKLAPQASHTAELQALFCCPGVFNLNRFRLHVVSSGAGQGTETPTPYLKPVERLIHIKPATDLHDP